MVLLAMHRCTGAHSDAPTREREREKRDKMGSGGIVSEKAKRRPRQPLTHSGSELETSPY